MAVVEYDEALIHLLCEVLVLVVEDVPPIFSDSICYHICVGTIVEITPPIITHREPTDACSVTKLESVSFLSVKVVSNIVFTLYHKVNFFRLIKLKIYLFTFFKLPRLEIQKEIDDKV